MSTITATPTNPAVPPHNIDAERSVLGALLLDPLPLPGMLLEVGLTPEDFYRERHGHIFAAICQLATVNEPVDYLTISAHLERAGLLERVGGPASIEELAGWVPAAGHSLQYAQIVREHAQLRRLLSATYEIQASVHARDGNDAEALIDRAEQAIFALRAGQLAGRQRLLSVAVEEEIERLESAVADQRELPGIPTGLRELDRLLGGLQDGRLYVVAARPAMGKSLLSLQIARHVATAEAQRVLFASLEMSDSETAQRHLAAESGVDPERIHLGKVTANDWPPLLSAAAASAQLPMHLLDDGDLSLTKLRAQARQLAQRHDRLGLVVVDYLQLMRAERPTGNRVEDVSEFSRGLKRLARELACPVIAVAQLSRAVEQRPDKRPLLSDLRESGQIEADADCVLMLYRDDYYDSDSERPGELDIIVRKNRQGRLGQVVTKIDERLRFLPHVRDTAPF
jgi:replicative DNA helicase